MLLRLFAPLLLCFVCLQEVAAQDAAAAPEFRPRQGQALLTGTITFTFDNPQLQPAHYEIVLHGDGSGHFASRVGSAPPDDIANLPAQGQERDIRLSDAARDRLFATAAREKYFATKCDSGAAKIAFQGTKTLSYDGPDGHGSCTYNYSQDARLQWITSELTGLAATLEEGRRLAVQHEHARLVLDAELETLSVMVKDGQATEVQAIEPVLSAIIGDDNVMLRARRRAQALLDNSAVPSQK
jgi:hypothetical protein